jgi:hypothetical protein
MKKAWYRGHGTIEPPIECERDPIDKITVSHFMHPRYGPGLLINLSIWDVETESPYTGTCELWGRFTGAKDPHLIFPQTAVWLGQVFFQPDWPGDTRFLWKWFVEDAEMFTVEFPQNSTYVGPQAKDHLKHWPHGGGY